jgi:hypothetical protein
MDLWISYPTIRIQRLNSAGGQAAQSDDNAESLTIQAATALFEAYPDRKAVKLFAYCRAATGHSVQAPAYEIAVKTGIQEAVPFVLGGQMGGEPAMALLLLGSLLNEQRTRALLCCTHSLNTPLSGDEPLQSDAVAAALLVSFQADLVPRLHVLGVSSSQVDLTGHQILRDVDQALTAAARQGRPGKQITWGIMPSAMPSLLAESVRQLLPDTRWFVREKDRASHYGCTDTLVSLGHLLRTELVKPGEHGILWFAGQYGALGCAYVVVES